MLLQVVVLSTQTHPGLMSFGQGDRVWVCARILPTQGIAPEEGYYGKIPTLSAPGDQACSLAPSDAPRPAETMERLRERWPHTLVLDFQPQAAVADARTDLARLRRQSDPIEVCAQFVEWVDSTYPDRRHRDTLADVVEAVRAAEHTA